MEKGSGEDASGSASEKVGCCEDGFNQQIGNLGSGNLTVYRTKGCGDNRKGILLEEERVVVAFWDMSLFLRSSY